MINARRLGILQHKLEILPEFLFVANGFRHDVRQFMQSDKRQRIQVNQPSAFLFAVQTKRDFLALVLTIGGQFTRGEGLADALGVETVDQPFRTYIGRMFFLHVGDHVLHLLSDFGQEIGGGFQFGAFADAVTVSILGRDDALELE